MILSIVIALMLMVFGLPLLQSVPSASAQTPVVPSGILAYVPITIINLQSNPTPAGFQQLVPIDSAVYASLESSNLQNVEFFSSAGTIVPSWLESGDSNVSTQTVYWLNLGIPILGNSGMTVYMGFAATGSNLFNSRITGEAPQLSPVYGEYDDGASVFLYYTGFAGSSLPAGWAPHPTLGLAYVSYSVNNGVTFPSQSAEDGQIDYNKTYGSGTMIDVDATITGQTVGPDFGAIVGYRLVGQRGQTYWGMTTKGSPVNYSLQTCYITPCVYAVSNEKYTSGTPVIGTIGFTGTDVLATNNYGPYVTNSSDVNIFPANPTIQQGASGLSLFIQWLRVRALPPNGVMPFVVLGPLLPMVTTTTVTSTQRVTTIQTQTSTFVFTTIQTETVPTTFTETSLATSYTTVVSSGDITQNAIILALLIGVSLLAAGEAIYILRSRYRLVKRSGIS